MIETSLRVFADLCIIRGTTTPKDIAREQTRNILRNLVKAIYDRVNYQLAQCSSQGSSREDRTRAEGHPQEFAAGYVSPPAT
jgi:hypothetical protein